MSPDMRMSMFDLTGYPHDKENVTQVQGKVIISFYSHTVMNLFFLIFGGHLSFYGATDTPVLDFW